MIDKFRRASETWVVKGLFLLMAVFFAIMWGGGDFIGRVNSNDQTVMTVGSRKISASEFFKSVHQLAHQIQRQTGQTLDPDQFQALGLYDQARMQLIQETLLNLEAERLGLMVTDHFIRTVIKKDAVFLDDQKNFSRQKFESLLSQAGFNEKQYIEGLRAQLMRQRLIHALSSAVVVPNVMSTQMYRWQNEQRQIQTLRLTLKDIIINDQPDEAELKKFFDKNRENFKASEYRDYLCLWIDLEGANRKNVASTPKLKDPQSSQRVQAEQNIAVESVSEVKKSNKQDALQKLFVEIEDAISSGESLQEIAQKYHLDLQNSENIDHQGQRDAFAVNSPEKVDQKADQAIVQEAFKLEEGHTSTIIDVGAGRYAVVQLKKIKLAHARGFDDVKEQIFNLWLQTEKTQRLQKLAQTCVQEINNNSLLSAVAAKYRLNAVNGTITRTGPTGPSVLKLSEQSLAQIFNLSLNRAQAFVDQQDQNSVEILVAVVNQITHPKTVSEKSTTDIQNILRTHMTEDVMQSYLQSLKVRFPVEINKKFFKANKAVKKQD